MNIQKIFKALEEDTENSALGIICQQLEEQGYKVFINGKAVSVKGFFEDAYPELESLSQLYICLKKGEKIEQEFILEFTDFHEIAIKRKQNAEENQTETMMLSNKEIEKAIVEISKKIQKEKLKSKEKSLPYPEIRDSSELKAIKLLKKKTDEKLSPTDVLTATTLIYDGVIERMQTKKKIKGRKKQ
jgi:hypothetical protein